jgi:hypothetical protein
VEEAIDVVAADLLQQSGQGISERSFISGQVISRSFKYKIFMRVSEISREALNIRLSSRRPRHLAGPFETQLFQLGTTKYAVMIHIPQQRVVVKL